MCKLYSKPFHTIVSLEKGDNWERFRITIHLPLVDGWFERVRLNVIGSESFNLNGVTYDICHKKNNETYAIFEGEVTLETSALYYYYISYKCNGVYRVLKREDISQDQTITKQECFKLSASFSAPEWAKGAIMYQIFPDRFYRNASVKIPEIQGRRVMTDWKEKVPLGPNEAGEWNTEFYGGNLLGIIDKLDYIQSLSVSVIYLNPICYGQSNHLYDTIDYTQVDPFLGTKEDLKKLCKEAHKRGIRIILDGVFNHTGNRSIYFDQFAEHGDKGAYHNPNSPYKNFYRQTWHNGTKYFNFWWGHKTLPECDTLSEEWIEYVTGVGGVIDQWFECGIDGIRLDVADELSDLMIERILLAVRRNKPDGFLFGEQWDNPMRRNRGFLKSGKGMHSIMNYHLISPLIGYYNYQNMQDLSNTLNEIFTEYPKDTIDTMMNFTSTHDISRAIELFATNSFNPRKGHSWDLDYGNASEFVKNHSLTKEEYEFGKEKLKSYLVALAFLPGIFSIFYGDEVGLQGIHNLANRAPFPWGKEDQDLLSYFRKMLAARSKCEFLKTAECKIKEISKEHFVYERISEGTSLLVVASRTHHETNLHLPKEYQNAEVIFSVGEIGQERLMPYGAIVLRK